MAETLGSLCDKLTIVKLKQYHCDTAEKATSLAEQERQLAKEINCFLRDAVSGALPLAKLTFQANKVYKQVGNVLPELEAASVGSVFAELAKSNCELWHEQEKVYAFHEVPAEHKDAVVKQLAILNLRRNQCIDMIDRLLVQIARAAGVANVF